MARSIFWPSNDSYTLNYQGEPQAGVPVRLYSRQSGGTQVTDLVYVGYDGSLGSAVPSGILISDSYGLLPAFAGPDGGPTTLWGNHGPQGERIALSSEPGAGGGGGGGAVSSVVGQTGSVTGTQILADSTVSTALGLKAPLVSPALTGTPTVPTAAPGTSTTQAASTAFVTAADAALTGTFASKSSAYASGVDYIVGQLVTSSGTLYRVTTAHTSSGAINLSNFAAAGAASEVGTDAWLKAWAGNPTALFTGTGATYDTNGVCLTAPVAWPDGTVGTFTATTVTALGTSAYTVTYGSKTVTQPTMTRNSAGRITARPARAVA